MRRWGVRWLLVIVLAGCYSPQSTRCQPCNGIDQCPGGIACVDNRCQEAAGACLALDDSGTEAMPPSEPGACMGVLDRPMVPICPPAAIPARVDLPPMINTSNASECTYLEAANASIGKPELCVIAAQKIFVPLATRVIGSRPLVLLGRDLLEVSLSGRILLNGRNGDPDSSTIVPAGSNLCKSDPGSPNGMNGGSGGGPGGTFRGQGGRGAAGGTPGTDAPLVAPLPIPLRGGCRGGDGGTAGVSQLAGGLGGNGGGAIYLLATKIQIDSVVNASGGGSRASNNSFTGGAGGGAGGMILLWSTQAIALTDGAQIFALGGGGGSGAGITVVGSRGNDPVSPVFPAMPISAAGSGGGDGGAGGSNASADGGDGIPGQNGGGGGGGGGVGYIKSIPKLDVDETKIAPASN